MIVGKKLEFGAVSLPWQHQLQHYLNQHWQAALWSVRKLTRLPLASFIALLIIGVTLTLPAVLNGLLKTTQTVTQQWYTQETLSLYLHPQTSASRIRSLKRALSAHPHVASVRYVSPEQGMKEFRQQNTVASVVSGLLDKNPLPAVFIIQPKASLSVDALERFHQQLARLPDVDIAQFDLQWVKRLHAFIHFSKQALFLLASLLGLGVVLIISNTIHLSIQGHEMEMDVLELMGATTGYMRRPFLYTGLLMGFAGGIIAWMSATVLLSLLGQSMQALAASYGGQLTLPALTGGSIFLLVFGSGCLGLIGAALGVRRQTQHRLRSF